MVKARIGTANANHRDLGLEIAQDDGNVSLNFDLEKIDSFRKMFGDTAFLEQGLRYIEERAQALNAHGTLWLWREAVKALVLKPLPSASDESSDSENVGDD